MTIKNYFLEQNIRELLLEADDRGRAGGDREGRHVAITASWSRDCIDDRDLSGRFDLKFTDRNFDLSKTMGRGEIAELKMRDAVRTIIVFLYGFLLDDDDHYFDLWINQAERSCFVVKDEVTPSRLKIWYDLPASEPVTAWRHHVSFITYLGDGQHSTARYIHKLY